MNGISNQSSKRGCKKLKMTKRSFHTYERRDVKKIKREERYEEDSNLSTNAIRSSKIENQIVDEKKPNIFMKISECDLKKEVKYPPNWAKVYNEVVSMRAKIMTPVDRVGCERIPEGLLKGVTEKNPRVFRFQLLISLLLSSQTKDEVNFEAMLKFHHGLLERGFLDGLCLEGVLTLTEQEIDFYIQKVGFHNKKAKYIKNSCLILVDKFGGDVPQEIEELMSLPGVGPKMGYLLLQRGWNKNEGIGIDVHLHRLAQLWGWVSKSKSPEDTRVQLEAFIPRKFWGEINPLLVGFGQTICPPKGANCDICTLGSAGLCKGASKTLLRNPLSKLRIEKLLKGRADLSPLLPDIEDLA